MIRLNTICKSYDGGNTFAARDISFEVARGELLVLLGSSGSGKTTTLKMMNRLIEPTSGAIELNSRDILHRDPVQLRREIGYVFQGIGLFPHMTVAQNVAIVPNLLGWNKSDTDERVDELLSLVHLDPGTYRDRRPSQLSGGQRQRVGFARALAARPSVMLLDEPFGALDPVTRDGLQLEFKQLHHKLGLTAVMVTHDIVEALLLASRIGVMHDGRLLQLDTPHALVHHPQDPYVAALMETPTRQAQQLQAIAGGS
jgi:osmoprotectant transport system ATP-binding protein